MKKDKAGKVEAIKYGDVFDLYGELAAKPIAPKDAEAMVSVENEALGQNPEVGVAIVMKAAAEENERRGVVAHDDTNDIVREEGAFVSETTIVGHRIISESIGDQVLGRFVDPDVKLSADSNAN